MITEMHVEDFAIFDTFVWEKMGTVNVVIGENDTGKSHLLKLLYAVARSLQDYERGQEARAPRWAETLASKLQWIFQPPEFALGKLVQKGKSDLDVTARIHGEPVHFRFGKGTTKAIRIATKRPKPNDSVRTLFFPPKEVLTPRKAIITMREQLSIPGFSDTYYDLAKALGHATTQGRIQKNLERVLHELEDLFEGRIEQEQNDFVFRRGQGPKEFAMSQTAEGIKKIGLLAHLIRNRNVREGATLFFDEPAAHLHPEATLKFVEMLYEMSKANIQIFIATHSYTVLKQLELLARKNEASIPLCVLTPDDGGVRHTVSDLRERIPANSIVDASMELFNKDLELSAR